MSGCVPITTRLEESRDLLRTVHRPVRALVDGIEATRRLAGPDPLPIAIITTFDLDEYVHDALKAGPAAFLLKDAGPGLLTQAIHAAAKGGRPDRAQYDRPAAVRVRPGGGHTTEAADRIAEPPARRRSWCRSPSDASTTRSPVDVHITPSTVKTHIASLMRKLGARNRVEVAIGAFETGRT